MAERDKPSTEESFRESLKDVLAIIQRMAPHCGSLEELAETVKLGLENDVHLRLLLSVVMKGKK